MGKELARDSLEDSYISKAVENDHSSCPKAQASLPEFLNEAITVFSQEQLFTRSDLKLSYGIRPQGHLDPCPVSHISRTVVLEGQQMGHSLMLSLSFDNTEICCFWI